jgi:FkbM family methyltransferase
MHPLDNIRFQVSRKVSYFLLHLCDLKGAGYLRKKLCSWLVAPPNGSTICPTLFGVDILVDPLDWIGKSIYYYGEYEAGTRSVLKDFLHTGDVFLDVGAYIGFHACVVAKFVGESGLVYAIEPNPEIYKILLTNIHINKLTNVSPLKIALGAEDSETRIYGYDRTNRGAASLIRPQDINEESGKLVRVTTVDKLIENGQLRVPNLIKIDVEGFELEVLKGAKTLLEGSQAPMLCLEYSRLHPQSRGTTRDIYTFIKSVNDYSLYRLKKGKGVPSELVRISREQELPDHDDVFCFLNGHLNR